MNIQLKRISSPDNIVDTTNEELKVLGNNVIDVDIYENEDDLGGYSIIKYTPEKTDLRRTLTEQKQSKN